jgi:hypothetical protein
LLLSDSVFVIGAANVGYLIFNFLNLNGAGFTGWTARGRTDPGAPRPGFSPPAPYCPS